MGEEDWMAKIRIHVRGLGETVTGDDLRKIFSSLGTVDGVEVVRTKGRSFAYVDFVPALPNSLSRLLSTYNGCAWKGGRMRLEKAKEHYLARLRREWEEDAQLASKPPSDVDDADKIRTTSEKPKKDKNLETRQLRLFFPRLGKVKSLPLSGTGKHKYSFQRVEVPALPLHFCDCEEHAGPFHSVVKRQFHDQEEKDVVMNEEEIKIMDLVMKKLFERENVSTVSSRIMSKEEDNVIRSTDSLPLDENESDEDNLITNVVSRENNIVALSGRNEEKRFSIKKSQFSGKHALKGESIHNVQKVQKNNILPAKKMKRLLSEGDKNEVVTLVPGGIENSQYDENGADFQENEAESEADEDNLIINVVSKRNKMMTSYGSMGQEMISSQELRTNALQKSEDGVSKDALKAHKKNDTPKKKRKSHLNEESDGNEPGSDGPVEKGNSQIYSNRAETDFVTQPTGPESGTTQSNASYLWSQKSSWRALVGDMGRSSFSVSNILQKVDPIEEEKPLSDDPKVDNNSHNKNELVLEPVSDYPKVDNNNHNKIEMVAASEDLEGMSGKIEENDTVVEPQQTKPHTVPSEYGRGSSWLHKSSWMQLVSESDSLFSISDVLPSANSAKETLIQPSSENVVTFTSRSHDNGMKPSENGTIESGATDLKDGKEEGSGQSMLEKNQLTLLDNGDASAPVIEKKRGSAEKKATTRDASIGETCTFMRSAASLKEWANTKAALSGSRKRKGIEK
ncbi:hypothetical protein SLE2022_060600 [Rubroshorea leprosula]